VEKKLQNHMPNAIKNNAIDVLNLI